MLKKFNGHDSFYDNVFKLLDSCFPGIKNAANKIEEMDAPWYQNSIPFIVEKKDTIISHLGLIPLRLIIENRFYTIAGFHAICTDPNYRMKGYSRHLFEEAMAYTQRFFDCVVLFTDKPYLYERYNFKVIDQYNFSYAYDKDVKNTNSQALKCDNKDYVALIQNYCQNRVLASTEFGDIPTKPLYTINCLDKKIYYSDEFKFIIVYKTVKQVLYLQDILCFHPIELNVILDAIPEKFTKVIFEFVPNMIAKDSLEPIKLEREEKLMVSKDFPSIDPITRCPEMVKF